MNNGHARLDGWWWWAAVGVVLMLVESAYRLGVRGYATMRAGLDPFEWLLLVVILVLFLYGEGYRALQVKWSPWVVRRMEELHRESLVNRILAPLYVTGLVGKPRGTLVRAWIGLAAIVAAILILRRTPDPWRGIVNVGVASALTWGTIAFIINVARRARASRQPAGVR